MKNILKRILFSIALIVLSYAAFGLFIQDDSPSMSKDLSNDDTFIDFNAIQKAYDKPGSFKSNLVLKATASDKETSFVGQELRIEDYPNFDQIQVGIQNQNKLVVRLFQNEQLMREATQTTLKTLPLNTIINLSTAYFAEKKNQEKSSENTLQVRLYEGTGFFGDIGTLNVDLNGNVPLNGNIRISALTEGIHPPYRLTELSVWKDYESFD